MVLTLIFAVYALVLGSRDAEAGEATARQLTDRGLSATGMELDATDPENVRSVADEIGRTYGRLDVLVNNAGVMVEVSAARLAAAEFRSVCEVNLLGAATMVHEMLPLLRSSAHPRIVSVSSTTASLSLTAAGAHYGGDAAHRIACSVSKTALNMLTLQYARAFAADPDLAHIKINAVTPGYVATDMSKGQGTRTVSAKAPWSSSRSQISPTTVPRASSTTTAARCRGDADTLRLTLPVGMAHLAWPK
ncbi:SDR family NAD(P)-dependent oxidoreductase [Streptomyces sp. NPDC003233]